MIKSALLASTAVGLLLCAGQASAQVQQRGTEERTSPTQPPGAQSAPGKSTEPAGGGAGKGETKERAGKGSAQTDPPSQSESRTGKGTAEQGRKEKSSKGAGESPESKGKGAAEKAPEPGKGTRGAAEKAPEPGKGTRDAEKRQGSEGAGSKGARKEESGSSGRVQLTEQRRTDVGQALAKERSLNRATNVHVAVNIGARLPRSVRLVAVPASIVAIVPEYRSYSYVVVEDRVCIVEPRTLEIVEVIPLSGHSTARGEPSGRLVLTEEERAIILREVEMDGGSTLGLGAIVEGGHVPREIRLRTFPDAVVRRVPKVSGYRYVAAENRVAIVDPQGSRVALVIEERR